VPRLCHRVGHPHTCRAGCRACMLIPLAAPTCGRCRTAARSAGRWVGCRCRKQRFFHTSVVHTSAAAALSNGLLGRRGRATQTWRVRVLPSGSSRDRDGQSRQREYDAQRRRPPRDLRVELRPRASLETHEVSRPPRELARVRGFRMGEIV
jgi:hypothetical protein